MSIFSDIANKIFHTAPAAQAAAPPANAETPASSDQSTTTTAAPAGTGQATATSTGIDVGAVLDAMAAMKPDGGGNYQSSIVDLLKLLDLDSSQSAPKTLSDELGVHTAADGSAEQNIALHRAVMDKLEANGGVVPDSLRQ